MLCQEEQFGKPALSARWQLFTTAQADWQCQEPKLIADQMNKNVFLGVFRAQSHFNRFSKISVRRKKEKKKTLASPFDRQLLPRVGGIVSIYLETR